MHSIKPLSKLMTLNEQVSFADASVDNGIIKGVKLLGEVSRNGRRYPQSTRIRAMKMMEGLKVNLNHADKRNPETTVESRIGKLVNVREENNGTYADFHFLTSHPFAAQIIEASQRMPEVYGFSINGAGTVKKNKAGELIVENIDSLRSIDLVADAGTVKSLFESADAPEAKSCEQLIGELIAALVAEGKEDAVKDVIKLKKKICGDGKEEEDSPAPEASDDSEAPAEESWKQDYKKLKLEKGCRELLESNSISVENELLETLMSLKDDASRSKFISWHKRNRNVKAPRSGASLSEPANKPTDYLSILRGN